MSKNEEDLVPKKSKGALKEDSKTAKKSEKSMKVESKKTKKAPKKKKVEEVKPVDLTQIKTHYEHRRMLRKQKKVLRYGEMATLRA